MARPEPEGDLALHAHELLVAEHGRDLIFGIITRQAIRRGTFRSVKDLTAAIGAFIDAYNQRCQPFIWTKDADELIAKIRRRRNQTVKGLMPRDTRSWAAAAVVEGHTAPCRRASSKRRVAAVT